MKVLQSEKCGFSSEVIFPTNRGKPTPNLAKYQEKSDLSTFLFLDLLIDFTAISP